MSPSSQLSGLKNIVSRAMISVAPGDRRRWVAHSAAVPVAEDVAGVGRVDLRRRDAEDAFEEKPIDTLRRFLAVVTVTSNAVRIRP